MAARADRLGDAGAGAPGRWEDGLRDGRLHVLLTLAGRDDGALVREGRRLREDFERHGLELTFEQPAAVLREGT
ncbi:MAG: hypothetical protein QOF29_1422, partial [bacterium]